MSAETITGAELLRDDDFAALRGRHVGVLSNPTGLLPDLTHTVDAMVAAGLDVRAVFGPEHGFRGTAQAGFSEPDAPATDARTGVRLVDTYQASPADWATWLRDLAIDTLVVDLQDVGVRFFTYIWSLLDAMSGAVTVPGVNIVVLDRPNPQGRALRGPLLREGFTSEIGGAPILLQHGLTMGELAQVFARVLLPARGLSDALDVEVIGGWDGERWTSPVWVPPSPGLPTLESALLYPGTGLFEAVNLSEGRGTTTPFLTLGAPWVDARWAAAMTEAAPLETSGVLFRACAFQPRFGHSEQFGQFAGEICQGLQVHVVDADLLDAARLGIALMVAARDLYPEFSHRGDDWRWLGLMTGSNTTRDLLTAGATADEICAGWAADADEWREICQAAGVRLD